MHETKKNYIKFGWWEDRLFKMNINDSITLYIPFDRRKTIKITLKMFWKIDLIFLKMFKNHIINNHNDDDNNKMKEMRKWKWKK